MAAVAFVAELRANVDALYAGKVTHDEHHVRNGETWRRIRDAGVEVEDEVLRLLRKRI